MKTDVVVVGGGASGMMAALTAAQSGACVVLLEPNAKLGRKLYITGKGRCNLTNACTPEEVLRNTPCNGRFLYSSVARFTPDDVMKFFETLGVPLKTERGNRVFPVSDKAADVIDALFMALRRARVSIVQERAGEILTQGGAVCGVRTDKGTVACQAVVLATGGASYPLTGSTGDGYRMAEDLGLRMVPPKPSLVPLEAAGEDCRKMQGLSLRNVAITVKDAQKKVCFGDQGELLFTHFGLSGPLILSASAHMRSFERTQYHVLIDLKPALAPEALDRRLLRDFTANPNKEYKNGLDDLLPRLMIPVVVERSGIPPETKLHSVTRTQRRRLSEVLKAFRIDIIGPRPVAEAIITSGGVSVKEVDPRTMECTCVPGLFLAGELLDVDAYTGGFNLQIAWSTGRAAGEGAAAHCAMPV